MISPPPQPSLTKPNPRSPKRSSSLKDVAGTEIKEMTSMLSIRMATVEDAATLNILIHELAEYEKLLHETSVTEEDIIRDAFGDKPKFRAVIAEWKGEVAGYALFFDFYSTFQGRTGLFLEDIFVRPQLRKKGIGKELLA